MRSVIVLVVFLASTITFSQTYITSSKRTLIEGDFPIVSDNDRTKFHVMGGSILIVNSNGYSKNYWIKEHDKVTGLYELEEDKSKDRYYLNIKHSNITNKTEIYFTEKEPKGEEWIMIYTVTADPDEE